MAHVNHLIQTSLKIKKRFDWAVEDETNLSVDGVIQDQLPQAITLEILRATTAIDPDLQLLKEDIITKKTTSSHLPEDIPRTV